MGIKLEVISDPFFGNEDMNINKPTTPNRILSSSQNDGSDVNGDGEEQNGEPETTVWICCDVYDTGIGIPGK